MLFISLSTILELCPLSIIMQHPCFLPLHESLNTLYIHHCTSSQVMKATTNILEEPLDISISESKSDADSLSDHRNMERDDDRNEDEISFDDESRAQKMRKRKGSEFQFESNWDSLRINKRSLKGRGATPFFMDSITTNMVMVRRWTLFLKKRTDHKDSALDLDSVFVLFCSS